jgi:class 3 adenylate cyclase
LVDVLERIARGEPLALDSGANGVLDALEAEALIEWDGRGGYLATAAGLAALRARGRLAPGIEPVTVMFTDLVESTGLFGRFGESDAHRLLRRHFALLRRAIAEHRGYEVKTLGDGLMVVFDNAADAARCAVAMQSAVARDEAGLELRVGVATGEPVREGNDYFGMPVIIARRLCDRARGGEIVVSDLVRSLAGGHDFESLGPLTLKGLQEPVQASALRRAPKPARAEPRRGHAIVPLTAV